MEGGREGGIWRDVKIEGKKNAANHVATSEAHTVNNSLQIHV